MEKGHNFKPHRLCEINLTEAAKVQEASEESHCWCDIVLVEDISGVEAD